MSIEFLVKKMTQNSIQVSFQSHEKLIERQPYTMGAQKVCHYVIQ